MGQVCSSIYEISSHYVYIYGAYQRSYIYCNVVRMGDFQSKPSLRYIHGTNVCISVSDLDLISSLYYVSIYYYLQNHENNNVCYILASQSSNLVIWSLTLRSNVDYSSKLIVIWSLVQNGFIILLARTHLRLSLSRFLSAELFRTS